MKEIIKELEQAKLFIQNIEIRGNHAYLDRESALACINRAISHLNVSSKEESDKCSHIPGKTADDCPKCTFMKPGFLEGSGICKYPIKQEESMTGVERIAAERKRQIDEEGFTAENDDKWDNDGLVMAAVCYAITSDAIGFISEHWPWSWEWWKRSASRIRELEKAGALIAAEIDRLSRLESRR
jgi:hypothetical protein